MTYVSGHGKFAVDVLAALGIDAADVTGFDLHCHAGKPVSVTVERMVGFPDAPDGESGLVKVLREYAVIERENAA